MAQIFSKVNLAISVAFSCMATTGCQTAGTTAAESSVDNSEIATAEVKPINTIANGDYEGIVKARTSVEVNARAEGVLRQMLFSEGASVTKGQPLFKIDSSVYQARVNKARANVSKAQANEVKARRDLERIEPLFKANAASQLDLDNAKAAYESARADLSVARADLALAQVDLDATTIKAPITGFISSSSVDVGSYVGPGSGPLATMVNVDTVYVEFNLTTEQYARSRQHGLCFDAYCDNPKHLKEYYITLRNTDGSPFHSKGVIDFVSHDADPSKGTVMIRAKVPNMPHALLPGSVTKIRVEAPSARDVITVPTGAIIDKDTQHFVYVKKGNDFDLRQVEPGPAIGDSTIIETGLKQGDQIVVNGFDKLPGFAKLTDAKAEK